MEIRTANRGDFEGCLALHKIVVGADSRVDFLSERVTAGRMYIAVDEGRVVALITFENNFVGCLYISLLLVHPDHRRRGIARALVERVAAHSKNGKLFSSTEADNDISVRMHEALGFRQSGYIDNLPQVVREIIYYKDID